MEKKSTTIKVMTYNVQWFTGINSQLEMQKRIMDKYRADVIGIQELTTDGKISSVGQAALAGYQYQYMSRHKNYLGIMSRYQLTVVKAKDFRNQDKEDRKRYGETRAYMRARLKIDGKTITIINTHLCYLTQDVKFKQMREIFRIAQRHKYCIILGDFNCFMQQPGDREYTGLYKQFADAGYNMADCRGKITKTWTDRTDPKSLEQFTWPTDNIITSGNIQISKVVYSRIKLDWPDGNPMDHIPIIATLQIAA